LVDQRAGNDIMSAVVVAVSQRESHRFSKTPRLWINLLAGLGVEGDAHAGNTVQHRSRVARDPMQPNLRQVHLLHTELLEELAARGFRVGPGDIGENILTSGVDLLNLPTDTILQIGGSSLRITGLRNPCMQLDRFQPGLMAATLERDTNGNLIRKAGVMSVVMTGGEIRGGDPIAVSLPPKPHRRLHPV
jgi:MOSC domain-containing protein YiiM